MSNEDYYSEEVLDEFIQVLDHLIITKIPNTEGHGVPFGKEPFKKLLKILGDIHEEL